ncbi:MAG: DUF1800 family protein [Verrucomicrobiaceae bacterium]
MTHNAPPLKERNAGASSRTLALLLSFLISTSSAATWGTPEYDDSSWSTGTGPIGFDTSSTFPYTLGTNLSSMRYNQVAVYMRTSFTLTAPQLAAISQLQLIIDYDDGYIAYLNGTEVSRGTMGNTGDFYAFNTPADDVHNGTGDNGETFAPPTINIDKSALRVGENILSGQVHNASLDSSDLLLYMVLGDGTNTFVLPNATYSYYIGTSEPENAVPTLPPHGLTQSPSQSDQDGNGLADVWEALYGAQGIDPHTDSDGDGLSNARESLFGTDPFDPSSTMEFKMSPKDANSLTLSWTNLSDRPGTLQSSTDLGTTDLWGTQSGTPYNANGMRNLDIPTSDAARFFRVQTIASDLDNDGVPDWLEPLLGFSSSPGASQSVLQNKSYDLDGNGTADISLSGDLAAFNEIYRIPEPGKSLTRAQAARLLLQTTFGPANMAQVDYVASIGAEAWLDQQIALPPSLTRPYIEDLKIDLLLSPANDWTDPNLSGYNINNQGQSNAFVSGTNFTSSWARSTIRGQDQLRQRTAFALSQILVASRGAAMLANQTRTTAQYYDFMIEGAFGNFEDLLLNVSLSPYMGHYLSHLGNQKEDPSIGRFPDENYAREIMQLFTIGLWELNLDGSRKLDLDGQPIPTYSNDDITSLSRVFTGVNYESGSFGGGWRDDGDSSGKYMTTPMKIFASHHDFTEKRIPMGVNSTGNRLYHTIPANPSGNNAAAMAEVETVVHQLVRHPNTAPFICKQLIQFLVTSNPTPAYVQRVASVFQNDGTGEVGNLEAVVRTILLDDEARNPMHHLKTKHFGHFREPTLRTIHLARILKIDQYPNLLWWDWGYYSEQTLQEPMNAPTVFNFYRPDFRLPGALAANQLDSPALGIVNSFSSVSFTNYLWRITLDGFDMIHGDQWYDGKSFPADYSDLLPMANDIPDLLDHLSILYCAGTLGAESRSIITNSLQAENDMTDRVRLAAFLVLVSPEGTCLK